MHIDPYWLQAEVNVFVHAYQFGLGRELEDVQNANPNVSSVLDLESQALL